MGKGFRFHAWCQRVPARGGGGERGLGWQGCARLWELGFPWWKTGEVWTAGAAMSPQVGGNCCVSCKASARAVQGGSIVCGHPIFEAEDAESKCLVLHWVVNVLNESLV